MKIYVGRWDLLPASWEGYNGLSEKSEEEIKLEVTREINVWADMPPYNPYNNFMGFYTHQEFEETFNQCLTHFIDSKDYWIKIF